MSSDPRNDYPYRKSYEWKNEVGQDARSIVAVAQAAEWLWLTERLFIQVPSLLTGAVCFAAFASVLTSDGRPLFVIGDLASSLATVSLATAALLVAAAIFIAAVTYWKQSLASQVPFLLVVYATALYFADKVSWRGLAGVAFFTAFVSTVSEALDTFLALHNNREPAFVLEYGRRLIGAGGAAFVGYQVVLLFI